MTPGPSLFDAAAERAALASGRPKSQERAEIMAPDPAPAIRAYCASCGVDDRFDDLLEANAWHDGHRVSIML